MSSEGRFWRKASGNAGGHLRGYLPSAFDAPGAGLPRQGRYFIARRARHSFTMLE